MATAFEGLCGAGSEVARQAADFGQALIQASVEKPINGVSQLVNHALPSHLPELHIVDGEAASRSAGGMLGSIAGSALNFYALNKLGGGLLGELGGRGIAGSALRMGITGAVYEGVFTPSDINSASFFGDRLTSAMVGGTTFAAMGAMTGAMNATGWFAVPEARGLGVSMLFGAGTGVGAGIAPAESSALFKDGNLMTNGKWSDIARGEFTDSNRIGVNSVTINTDGSVRIVDAENNFRQFAPGKAYESTFTERVANEAKARYALEHPANR